MNSNASALNEKIQTLAAEQISELEQFVEFLRFRGQERDLTCAAETLSAPAFEAIWDNPGDEAYDALEPR